MHRTVRRLQLRSENKYLYRLRLLQRQGEHRLPDENILYAVFPTFSISPVRIHFWHVVTLFLGGISCPVKYGFNGAIPELINNKLLSLFGTNEKLFITRCSLLSKKFKNIFLSSFTPYCCMIFLLSILNSLIIYYK